jgi:hypothetical protein
VFPQILRRSSRKLPPNLPNGSKKQIDLWSSALLSCDRAAGWQPQEAGESLTLMSKKNHPERMKPDSKIIFIYNDFPPFFFPRERLADYSKKGDRKKRCWCMWLLIWAYEFLLPQETDLFLLEKQDVFPKTVCFPSLTAEQVIVENAFPENFVQFMPILLINVQHPWQN